MRSGKGDAYREIPLSSGVGREFVRKTGVGAPAGTSWARRAWAETDHHRALEQLQCLADELDHTHPGAASSLRAGMEATLAVIGLGIRGKLKRAVESTNHASR